MNAPVLAESPPSASVDPMVEVRQRFLLPSGGPSVELLILLAALMSLNALAIDIVLPALPLIGEQLGLQEANARQWVIIGFALGMGFGQLIFGPLTDRYGRRSILLFALIAYALVGAACNYVVNFEQLIFLRIVQGAASSGPRVVAVAAVRDVLKGAAMARTMSFIMAVFMAVPILAPAMGQVILLYAEWRTLFWFLTLFAGVTAVWAFTRLPETLPVQNRQHIDPLSIFRGYLEVLSHPISFGYMVASGFMFGALLAFLGASEQIFAVYDRADYFAFYFAGLASAMALANILNANLVRRFGPKGVSYWALAAFIGLQVIHFSGLFAGLDEFYFVYTVLVLTFGCLSLMGANFGAIALEPMGHRAGVASAMAGFVSTTLAALLGGSLGQRFDGTTMPFALGYLMLAVIAAGIIAFAERRARRIKP